MRKRGRGLYQKRGGAKIHMKKGGKFEINFLEKNGKNEVIFGVLGLEWEQF